MSLFQQKTMAEKIIDHTNAERELATAEKAHREASHAYYAAIEELPKLEPAVMNSDATRQRMRTLKQAYDTAWKVRDKAREAERKTFNALSA